MPTHPTTEKPPLSIRIGAVPAMAMVLLAAVWLLMQG